MVNRIAGRNAHIKVLCAECGLSLCRRPLRPYDYAPISQFFCDRTCKGKWQRRQKPVDEAWLRQKYLVEGLSAPDIASIVGRNSKRVWEWLRDYGIETRPRGHDVRVHFGSNDPRSFSGSKHTQTTKNKIRDARLADGHFPKQPNGSPYWLGKNGVDHPSWRGGATPERQAFYQSEAWRRACVAVWRRSDAYCEKCGRDSRSEPSKNRSFHVHHVVSFQVKSLRAEPINLVLLCAPCHRFVHSKRNVDKLFIGEDPCKSAA